MNKNTVIRMDILLVFVVAILVLGGVGAKLYLEKDEIGAQCNAHWRGELARMCESDSIFGYCEALISPAPIFGGGNVFSYQDLIDYAQNNTE